jgi:endonuclease YncB( thermonuclease family)
MREKNRRKTPEVIQRAAWSAILLFFAVAAGCAAENHPVLAESFPSSGTVITVYDGDTVRVRFTDGSESRVRFIGIDAAELDNPREEVNLKAQPSQFTSFWDSVDSKPISIPRQRRRSLK